MKIFFESRKLDVEDCMCISPDISPVCLYLQIIMPENSLSYKSVMFLNGEGCVGYVVRYLLSLLVCHQAGFLVCWFHLRPSYSVGKLIQMWINA